MSMYRKMTAVATAGTVLLAGCGAPDGEAAGGDVEAVAGFDGTTIRLGVLTPLTTPAAELGEQVTHGHKVWFEHLNDQGGIAGEFPVELVERDTQYRPDLTVQLYNEIRDDVLMFAQVFGTPSILAVLEHLKDDGVMAAPASLDAFWVREENLLPIGAPYQIEAANALHWYLTEGGGDDDSVICAMVQDDVYGEAGLEGFAFAAERRDVDLATTQRFGLGAGDYTAQIQALTANECEMTLLVASPVDSPGIWGTAAEMEFPGRWIAQSPAWIDVLAESPLAPYLQQAVHIVADGTEWGDQSVPGMVELEERQQEYAPDVSPEFYFGFGYSQARAVTELLEKAVESGDLSREGLLAASEQLGTVSFEGLFGDYDYGPIDERNPPRTSTVFAVDPDNPYGLRTEAFSFSSSEAEMFEFEHDR